MSFTKKFKKGDFIVTNEEWAENVGSHEDYVRVSQGLASQGSTKCGVVVDEYQCEQPLSNDEGLAISSKGGGILHLVDFVDSNGIKHTSNAGYLELVKKQLKKL